MVWFWFFCFFLKYSFLLRPSPAPDQYFSTWPGEEEAGAGSKARSVAGVNWLEQQLRHRKVRWFTVSCTGLLPNLSLSHPFFCALKFVLQGYVSGVTCVFSFQFQNFINVSHNEGSGKRAWMFQAKAFGK